MKLPVSARYFSFTKDEQDVVTAMVDIYKHRLYDINPQKYGKYASSAQGKSYEEKVKLFNEALIKEAVKRSGIQLPSYSADVVVRHTAVREMMFDLISEALTIIFPNTVLDQFSQFAEVRNVGWGDNLKFTVPNNALFVVSRMGNGVRRGTPQRLYNSEVILTPETHEVTIQEDLYRLLSGKVDWADWISRAALSLQTDITTMIYKQFYNSINNLNASFKAAAFDTTDFVELAQRVSAANGGARTTVWGTQLALSKVIPDADFKKYPYVGAGEEYLRNGFLGNYMGTDLFMIDQRIIPNDPDYNFAINDDVLYFVTMATDKPVKVGFEGSATVFDANPRESADLTQNYTIQMRYDAIIATSSKYGAMIVG
ncbi:MAG: hypothetical protein GX053_15405 [Tissierella sp.]|nr:hypothetical protein [Tissierella sp.]